MNQALAMPPRPHYVSLSDDQLEFLNKHGVDTLIGRLARNILGVSQGNLGMDLYDDIGMVRYAALVREPSYLKYAQDLQRLKDNASAIAIDIANSNGGPLTRYSIVEFGPGDEETFDAKTKILIEALKTKLNVVSYHAFDANLGSAQNSARLARQFVDTSTGHQEDFMAPAITQSLQAIGKVNNSKLIVVGLGGTFSNLPQEDGISADDRLKLIFSYIAEGCPGGRIVASFDTNTNHPERIYETAANNAFLMRLAERAHEIPGARGFEPANFKPTRKFDIETGLISHWLAAKDNLHLSLDSFPMLLHKGKGISVVNSFITSSPRYQGIANSLGISVTREYGPEGEMVIASLKIPEKPKRFVI